ncbi:hypothetical protein Taro_021112 [Colocasia esculenta]|uniref:Uncharacterized protein n=1 Tax=Colocasia esculenta TaxID=4460 RepID=A0A843UY37_COLES|nr:hypothetical protein [Colocasia esculenta]
MQTDLQKVEDWASRETVSYVDLSTGNLVLSTGTNISCKGSVDTMVQSKGRNVKKRSSSVDTSPGQVDTRVRFQRN